MDQFSMPIGAARSTERVQSIFGPAKAGRDFGRQGSVAGMGGP
ncbi:protein of unassigned function [Methylobacterium oryzae CBMB20]|uniref:Protein of unassigned function n=1 Tax=Methylobacterium oryzae CBMB20 TaxID=693986 RepID=A0A089P0I5_9HYPH|nr:protein of unassigned function [Methylobacterium oryzae CBMB20]